MTYPEKLLIAVEYLLEKGVTKPSEIARRLNISPTTATTVKYLVLRRKRQQEAESQISGAAETVTKAREEVEAKKPAEEVVNVKHKSKKRIRIKRRRKRND